jgi:transcriptional regulator with XRE-family HTH domain
VYNQFHMLEEMVEVTYFDNEQIKQMGKRIKECRKKKKMTQSQLADILGISTDQVSNIELGKSACKTDHIYLLIQVLDISADYLLKGNMVLEYYDVTGEQITNIILKFSDRKKGIIYEMLTYMM